jgi:hypothetical protein
MRRVRGLLGSLGVSLASLLVLLLALEGATRAFGRVGPTLIVKDARIGKRYRPGFEGDVYVAEAGRRVRLRFNRDGFRGPDRPDLPSAGVRRIAVIGDSMTVAVATDEGRTFVRLLEASLNAAAPESRWEALNFGVASASTGQELVVYREVAARYRPELVVCAFYVGNDLADNSSRLTRAPRLYFELSPGGGLRQAPLQEDGSAGADWLDRHSRFYVWQKAAVAALRARGRSWSGELDPGQRVFVAAEDPDLSHAWTLTERLLSAFRDEAAGRGARLVLAVLPCAEQVYDDLWRELVARSGGVALDRELPERRLAEIGARIGVPVVTMARAFREAAPRASTGAREEWLFLNGRHHLNDAGHRLAARLIHAAVAGP